MKSAYLIKILTIVMSVLMLVSMFVVDIYAENDINDFVFFLAGTVNKTGIRTKNNDSSMYMYCTSTTTPYIASAWGVDGSNYTEHDCSYEYGVAGDMQRTYLFISGNRRFMYNYVIENGYDMCFIKGDTSVSGTAYGFWNPDGVFQSNVISANDYIRK